LSSGCGISLACDRLVKNRSRDVIVHDHGSHGGPRVSVNALQHRRPLVGTAKRKDGIHLFAGWVRIVSGLLCVFIHHLFSTRTRAITAAAGKERTRAATRATEVNRLFMKEDVKNQQSTATVRPRTLRPAQHRFVCSTISSSIPFADECSFPR
jgi:hypothetical protein